MITRSEILRRLRFLEAEAGMLASEIEALPPPRATTTPATTAPTVAADSAYTGPRPMPGRHIAAPSAGRCGVCGTSYSAADMIIWNDDRQVGACPARCGVPRERGARG